MIEQLTRRRSLNTAVRACVFSNRRWLLLALAALGVLGLAGNGASANSTIGGVKPYVTYDHDRLQVFLRASEMKPMLDHELGKLPLGQVHSTDSQRLTLRNPRVTFKNDAISVRLDYSVGTRGWTEVPSPTISNPGRKRKVYTPWVTDTGWIEVDLRTQISNGVLSVHTRNAYVRWSSRNKFTNLIRDVFDQRVRDNVAKAVNDGIRNTLGGRQMDLKPLVLDRGAPVIARQLRRPEPQARQLLSSILTRSRLDAKVTNDGITASISVPQN